MKQRKHLILDLLEGHRLLALATNRPDGWPHVTSVGYVNDGFLVYCFIASNSQKHTNIRRDDRVSAAISSDALVSRAQLRWQRGPWLGQTSPFLSTSPPLVPAHPPSPPPHT